MGKYVTVELEHVSGLVEDRCVNTFAFVGGTDFVNDENAATLAELDQLAQVVEDFYNVPVSPSTRSIADFISDRISRVADASRIKIYEIGTNQFGGQIKGQPSTFLGSPIFETTFQLAPPIGSGTLPEEVALALRWEAAGRAEAPVEAPDSGDTGSEVDRPRQRKTGRIYIGPIASATNDSTTGRPQALHLTDVLNSAEAFAEAVVTTVLGGDMQLGVWSRKDEQISTLEAVVVDNAFDTQRRRGVAPTLVTRRLVN